MVLDVMLHQRKAIDEAVRSSSSSPAAERAGAQAAAASDEGQISDDAGEDDDEAEEAEAEDAAAAPPAVQLPDHITVASVLKDAGLESLQERFEQEDIDLAAMMQLSDTDYKEMSVSIGNRKKITGVLAALQQQVQASQQRSKEEERFRKRMAKLEAKVEKRRQKAERAEQAAKAALANLENAKSAAAVPASAVTVHFPVVNIKPACFFMVGAPVGEQWFSALALFLAC